jgi:hypothetical protein
MMLIRTQHQTERNRSANWRQTVPFDPPMAGARMVFVDWPDDPKSQPVEITWAVGEQSRPAGFIDGPGAMQ